LTKEGGVTGKTKVRITFAVIVICAILLAFVFAQTNFLKKTETYPVTLSNVLFPSSEPKETLIMIGIFKDGESVRDINFTDIDTYTLAPLSAPTNQSHEEYVTTEKYSIGQELVFVRGDPTNPMIPENTTIIITSQMLEKVNPIIVSDNGSYVTGKSTLAIVVPTNLTWNLWALGNACYW